MRPTVWFNNMPCNMLFSASRSQCGVLRSETPIRSWLTAFSELYSVRLGETGRRRDSGPALLFLPSHICAHLCTLQRRILRLNSLSNNNILWKLPSANHPLEFLSARPIPSFLPFSVCRLETAVSSLKGFTGPRQPMYCELQQHMFLACRAVVVAWKDGTTTAILTAGRQSGAHNFSTFLFSTVLPHNVHCTREKFEALQATIRPYYPNASIRELASGQPLGLGYFRVILSVGD